MKKLIKLVLLGGITIMTLNYCTLKTKRPLQHLFPINNYNQNVDKWLNPDEVGYSTKSLLDANYQEEKFKQLKAFYYGESSPWSQINIERFLIPDSQGKSIYLGEISILDTFNNDKNVKLANPDNHVMYGMNFRAYDAQWLSTIKTNMDIAKLLSLHYNSMDRAITITPTALRMLPTRDPAFLTNNKAGEGYPFDYLQNIHLLAATPVYIISRSLDKKWALVLSPEAIGWVLSSAIATVSPDFITSWTSTIQNDNQHGLAGIIKNELSILNANGQYAFSGYVGTLLPIANKNSGSSKINVLIPVKNLAGNAVIESSQLDKNQVVRMPMAATKENFAILLKANQGRPYGWGGVNNYNDCSAETKGIYTMFGIFLLRDTHTQVQNGKLIDLSKLTAQQRINYLLNNKAKPLFTLMWIPGHIMFYIGNYVDNSGNKFIQSYQQVWGLKPKDSSWRSIIGMASFLPIILNYPEEPQAISEIARDQFKLIDLSAKPNQPLQLNLSNLLY